jgi:oxygen-independent coproporphyrinogen III oxidase
MRNSGLYVHVPFCRTKCIYCDFYSTTQTGLVDGWFEALEQEILLRKQAATRFDSLYIGGGTPTVLGCDGLARLFAILRDHFTFLEDIEITVEANPDDASDVLLARLKSLGVNRLSFGVQSFEDKELTFLKRRHDSAGAQAALEAARREGFSNIGIDLIYGLPGQTKKGWLGTLERALSFSPAHLSCYQLTVEGKTPLALLAESGRVTLPGDEKERSLFLLTSRHLEARGFVHYEVSNFASSEDFLCRHNEKYWSHVPYLGLGPSAHSFDGARRWWNHRTLERYCRALGKGEAPVEDSEVLTPDQIELERCYLGLRTRRGVALEDLPERSMPMVRQLRKARLVRLCGNRLIPSNRGFLVADSLPVLLS